jgi:peptide/nickel transport system ATP-binding protein
MSEALLKVTNVSIGFETQRGYVRAVDDVSFELAAGETLGLVGESGCGKSVTALSLLRLVPSPPGRYENGSIHFGALSLLDLREAEMRKVRGKEISMIFQEPMTSLNPVYTVGAQIMEAILLHTDSSKAEAREKAIDLLHRVGIPSPESTVDSFPHELSGGMRQRVMIAMALACGPKVLIADEPTTALDVTIQAQIMELLRRLQTELGMAMIFITHDLMYGGQIVEMGSVERVFASPRHPYTQGLLASLPSRTVRRYGAKRSRLPMIAGMVPDLTAANRPKGCLFFDRCDRKLDRCAETPPALAELDNRAVRCYNPVSDAHVDGSEGASLDATPGASA